MRIKKSGLRQTVLYRRGPRTEVDKKDEGGENDREKEQKDHDRDEEHDVTAK